MAQAEKPSTESAEQQLANLICSLADEINQGKQISLDEACKKYPEFAEDLRELWGTMVVTKVAGEELNSTSFQSGEPTTLLELPFDLGEYVLEEEIGRGGMGIVYRATRTSDESQVAIKMMLKGEFAEELDRQRFFAEAEAAARLDHQNIVPIYEIGEHQGRPFFCMKFVDGETLAERLSRGPLPSRVAARLLRDISKAIHYAHEKHVLHRDLKPSNILIDKAGRAYVADFGLAKLERNRVSLTKSGAVLGTPSYMSPEQAAGARGEVRPVSDVYSLGAILYHMLTGRPPFLAATPVDTVLMVLEQDPIAPRALNRRVDRSLEMIAMRCLQKPQDLRYENAIRLSEDLDAFLNNESVSAREGRVGQVIANLFRETHHAVVLENWGLLWMWHSLVLLVACFATNIIYLLENELHPVYYWVVWLGGFGTWAAVFWLIRRRMGPVTFVERQIAHIWAGSMLCVGALHPLELMLLDNKGLMVFSPIIAVVASMVFLIKGGILSGKFYLYSALLFVTSFVMACCIDYSMFIFGVVSAASFFFPGLKYYNRRKKRNLSRRTK